MVRRSDSTLHWAINGPEDILRRVPGARVLAAISAGDSDAYRQVSAVNRVAGSLMGLIPVIRNVSQYHRYAF